MGKVRHRMRIRIALEGELRAVRRSQRLATQEGLPDEALRDVRNKGAHREKLEPKILNLIVHEICAAEHRKRNALLEQRIFEHFDKTEVRHLA